MECKICKVKKLSNEFPPSKLTPNCRHPHFACMRCVLPFVREKRKCPYPTCGIRVNPEGENMAIIRSTLNEMFREYTSEYTPLVVPEGDSRNNIRIVVLTGDSITLDFNPQMTVSQLKEHIQMVLKHDVPKQKLLYNDGEIRAYGDCGKEMQLADYNVRPNSSIYLLIRLYNIPEEFDDVVFDLFWGYPTTGCDFLDASCLLFSRQAISGIVDFRKNKGEIFRAFLQHSGDVMNHAERIGHHTIKVKLMNIPSSITHLFFTLSAWNSPSLSKYPNPSLKFYETKRPNVNLCKTTFTHANHSQAVIMCSMSRSDGTWTIFESGKLSAGNAKNYEPLIQTIRKLIRQGF